MRRRGAKALVLAAALAMMMVLVPAVPAQAADFPWDGQSPGATVCGNDARTVLSSPLYHNGSAHPSAVIELRYSPNCRTVWARITGASSAQPGDSDGGSARVTRNYDGKSFTCSVGSGSSCYTAMVNDANMTSYAYGRDDTGFAIYTGRTGNF